MKFRKWGRVFVFVVVIAVTLQLAVSFYTAPETIGGAQGLASEGEMVAPPAGDVTVVTARGLQSGPNRNMMVAIGEDGQVLYSDDSFHNYYDVDPSDRGKYTVLLLAQEKVTTGKCSSGTQGNQCLDNVVLYLNLSTGERTRVFSRLRPGGNPRDADWHDVDYIGDDRYLVGDIQNNRAFILNVTTGEEEWSWSAQADYDVQGTGGPFPDAWTHLNDVEYLPDGRVMVSLRNQDQVVFLRPGEGLLRNQSLGKPDDHSILYEQHNPDYIPASEGGPAVLVAGSENNRIVEYQLENGGEGTDDSRTSSDASDGEWTRSWHWSDSHLQWPRDADRLPNGHTLVTDTNGGRVVEVNESGDIVWQVNVTSGYEAERLSTDDESAGGPAAAEADLAPQGAVLPRNEIGGVRGFVSSLLPQKIESGIYFVSPDWFGLLDYFAVAALVGTLVLWIPYELYRSPLALRTPVYRR